MSRCDYSTVAQDCSGNKDRALHPGSSPAGAAALPMSTKLQLSLSQPDGVMLMSASTGDGQIIAIIRVPKLRRLRMMSPDLCRSLSLGWS